MKTEALSQYNLITKTERLLWYFSYAHTLLILYCHPWYCSSFKGRQAKNEGNAFTLGSIILPDPVSNFFCQTEARIFFLVPVLSNWECVWKCCYLWVNLKYLLSILFDGCLLLIVTLISISLLCFLSVADISKLNCCLWHLILGCTSLQ